ncbi:MAG: hypothetical protein WBQ34_05855 [Candidatus Acidiferrales bacterium]
MSSGFNTDVRVGDQVFHVQTEDRGPSHPAIDTAVYQNGRVLLRRSSSYQEFAASAEFSPVGVRQRVEEQHRAVVQELRSGTIGAPTGPAAPPEAERPKQKDAGGIQVQLLNPQSWLSGGKVSLDLEILRRSDRQPRPGVSIEAGIEGSAAPDRHTSTSDDQGRARIQFPLPPLGKGDLTLVILASADGDRDEVRFAMRSRDKSTPSSAAPSA